MIAVLACAAGLHAQTVSNDWTLTFADEFSGKTLDLSRWSPNDPLRRAQTQHPEAASVSDGMLHVAANGLTSTYGLFSQVYGRFEIRCRIAGGRPRFALLPIPPAPCPASRSSRSSIAG